MSSRWATAKTAAVTILVAMLGGIAVAGCGSAGDPNRASGAQKLARGKSCGTAAPNWATVNQAACDAWLEQEPAGAGKALEEFDPTTTPFGPSTIRDIANGLYRSTLQKIKVSDETGNDLSACSLLWNVLNATVSEDKIGRAMTAEEVAASTGAMSSLARNIAQWSPDTIDMDVTIRQCGRDGVGKALVGFEDARG